MSVHYNALTPVHTLTFVHRDLRCYINKGLIPEWKVFVMDAPHSGVKHMHTSTYTCSVTLCHCYNHLYTKTHILHNRVLTFTESNLQ